MRIKGFIDRIGQERNGMSSKDGKPWRVIELTLAIPYTTSKGETKYDRILVDYAEDKPVEELGRLAAATSPLTFNVWFGIRPYNGRDYQTARLYSIAQEF